MSTKVDSVISSMLGPFWCFVEGEEAGHVGLENLLQFLWRLSEQVIETCMPI